MPPTPVASSNTNTGGTPVQAMTDKELESCKKQVASAGQKKKEKIIELITEKKRKFSDNEDGFADFVLKLAYDTYGENSRKGTLFDFAKSAGIAYSTWNGKVDKMIEEGHVMGRYLLLNEENEVPVQDLGPIPCEFDEEEDLKPAPLASLMDIANKLSEMQLFDTKTIEEVCLTQANATKNYREEEGKCCAAFVLLKSGFTQEKVASLLAEKSVDQSDENKQEDDK